MAWKWESSGADGYTISQCEKPERGTDIILKIKQNTEDERYDEFLEGYKLRELVKRYSDYIRYPIRMMMEKHRIKEQEKAQEADKKEDVPVEYESYMELETLNSMVPIWKKNKNELTEEDYNQFYQEKFFDYTKPAKVIHTSVEGASTYNALLFVPGKVPFNYYTKDFEKGLQLYSSGVLIMDKCPDLLPDYCGFVRGIVDSQDLSLNISREMLQHDRQLKAIALRLEKKIQSELLAMLNTEREKYESFFESFGLQLKYGLYDGYGRTKELLQDLILFYSSSEKKMVTLSEYVARMKAEQKYIYYACGDTPERIDKLPQIEILKEKGYEILYLTADVDEFAIQMLGVYKEKEFRSAAGNDLELEETAEEKEKAEKQAEENKELLAFMKESLGDKVAEVRLSQRLKSHPVCLASGGDLSLEMEKVLNAMPTEHKMKAERILEINANHDILKALRKAYDEDKDKAKKYTDLLYQQALLIEGFSIEDPVEFSNAVCSLMTV